MKKSISSVGIGLRLPHVIQVLTEKPDISWFELLVDNWFAKGGLNHDALDAISEQYSLTFHGVNLSLGSVDGIDFEYLKNIKDLMQRTGACWYSEHCSFSSFGGRRTPDLLPLPYTHEALTHLVNNIQQVQDFLGQPMLLENVSCYVEHAHNDFSESEFITEVAKQSGCYLLLDVNNVYVNSVNHSFDALEYIQQMPKETIREIHLGGHSQQDGFLLDTHGSKVADVVWVLYEHTLQHLGKHAKHVPTLIEWDNDLPTLDVLLAERDKAQKLAQNMMENNQPPFSEVV